MSDFFDQGTGHEEVHDDFNGGGSGATILVNGSHQPIEVGASFIPAVQAVALQAGFGKFRLYRNGVEVKPKSCPEFVGEDDRLEIRPYDEAGC